MQIIIIIIIIITITITRQTKAITKTGTCPSSTIARQGRLSNKTVKQIPDLAAAFRIGPSPGSAAGVWPGTPQIYLRATALWTTKEDAVWRS